MSTDDPAQGVGEIRLRIDVVEFAGADEAGAPRPRADQEQKCKTVPEKVQNKMQKC